MAGIQDNHENFVPSLIIIQEPLTDFHGDKAKKKKMKKGPKWPSQKNFSFSKLPIQKKNLRKFHRLGLGLVGLID